MNSEQETTYLRGEEYELNLKDLFHIVLSGIPISEMGAESVYAYGFSAYKR